MQTFKSDPYFLDKHRFCELKHFCLQYPKWKEEYEKMNNEGESKCSDDDPTSRLAIRKADFYRSMKIVEDSAYSADPGLYSLLLRAVTEGIKPSLEVDRERFYYAYRRFYWILDKEKGI